MWLWLSKSMGSHLGVGEFTTHFRTYLSGWIGMFTGGTIWILTHGHMAAMGVLFLGDLCETVGSKPLRDGF